MPLCLCIYLLVLFWSSIGVAVDDCFYPDGRYAVALSACNKQSPVTQCCRQGDVCLTNGLCFSPGLNLVLRRGCTDKTWRSTKCPDICTTGRFHSGDVLLISCGEFGAFCCGQKSDTRSCCTEQENRVHVMSGDFGQFITPKASITDPAPYQAVSSLYGPGTIAGWLLIMASVLISWYLGPAARKDVITNDLLAALTLPLVSCIHILYQVYRLPVSVAEMANSEDRALRQATEAIEAPLVVCEKFLILAVIIILTAIYKRHRSRLFCVIFVVLLCIAIETITFRSVPFRYATYFVNSNFSRPFLFHYPLLWWFSWGLILGLPGLLYLLFQHGDLGRNLSDFSKLSVVLLLVYYILWISYALVFTDVSGSLFPFPNSSTPIGELDQVVALVAGLITVGFSLHDIYRMWRARGLESDENARLG